ncbi:MAG: carboxypeptidase regulatory-like domain-containing protein [Candidatus Eisenbacteria bacterium]|nr:carboxypeptidase regulatory-like domain-containing protein [Candidatus Eisenbacteria bacterium]
MRALRYFSTALVGLTLAGACQGAGVVDPRILPVSLSGAITDGSGKPLPGVSVRAFIGGLPCASATSDADGVYLVEFGFDPELDETIIVWWIAPRTDLVSELALVRESARDRAQGLWGPCVPRIGSLRRQERSVQILDRAAVRRRLADSGCAR